MAESSNHPLREYPHSVLPGFYQGFLGLSPKTFLTGRVPLWMDVQWPWRNAQRITATLSQLASHALSCVYLVNVSSILDRVGYRLVIWKKNLMVSSAPGCVLLGAQLLHEQGPNHKSHVLKLCLGGFPWVAFFLQGWVGCGYVSYSAKVVL